MKKIILLTLCVALFACTNEPVPVKVESVELSRNELILTVDEKIQLKAIILPDNAENKSVYWVSEKSEVAIVEDGLVTAIASGTTTVIAITDDGGKKATCTVTVVPKPILVTGVTLNEENIRLFLGHEVTLTARVIPSDATNTDLIWETSNKFVATVAGGTVKALGRGSTVITVKTKDGGFKAECVVNVTEECQTQVKGPMTLDLGRVTATTAEISGFLDVDQLAGYDVSGGGVGFIYAPSGTKLDIDNAEKVSISSVDSENAFSKTLTGLKYDTRYHYTIYLRKNGILQYGETQYFDTKEVTISVDQVSVTPTKATLKGKVVRLSEDSDVKVGLMYSSSNTFPSGSKSYTITPYSGGSYTQEITGLTAGATYYYRTYLYYGGRYEYGETKEFTTLNPYNAPADLNVASATDLSYSVSANCYIVSQTGLYKFKTVKGNSSTSVGSVASASILWETFGTSTTPELCELIQGVCYKDSYIAFQTADTFKEGNAVVAAKDASGNILWSWHIWLTDQPQGQKYYNGAGTMMDRNLGATSATPGEVGALGLLYQWGRKDPFLGSSSISSSTTAKSTILWPSPVSTSSSLGTVSYVVANPTTFVKASSSPYDWHYSSRDNTLWTASDKTKSIYDPCPAGWRVPDGGDDGVWSKALGSSSDFTQSSLYNSFNKGMNFSGKFGSASTIWYPASGYLYHGGGLSLVGNSGSYWSASPYDSHAYGLDFDYYGSVYPLYGNGRAFGCSVRCLQESK